MTSYLQKIREMAKGATDKTAKTQLKDSFVSFGSTPQGAFQKIAALTTTNQVSHDRDAWPLKGDGILPDQLPEWYFQNLPVVKPGDTLGMREYLLALADELRLSTTMPIRRLTEAQLRERCELPRWHHKDWLMHLCEPPPEVPSFRSCNCAHWQPDKINPAQGMGSCKCGTWYPNESHACTRFEPAAEVTP